MVLGFYVMLLVVLLSLSPAVTAAPSSPISNASSSTHVKRGSLTLMRSPRAVTTIDDPWLKGNRIYAKHKYNTEKPSSSTSKRQVYGTSPITNFGQDYAYYTTLSVGTPPVEYNVLLDTGSSDLWFLSGSCQACTAAGRPTYSSTGSGSFSLAGSVPFGISYIGGDVNGTSARETISMAGFTVQNQAFGMVENFDAGSLPGVVAGLIGMGWKPLAKLGTPWWQNAAVGSQWAQPLFAVALSRQSNNPAAAQAAPGGSFTLGTVDPSLYTGEIDYVDIPPGWATWWIIPITEITVGGSVFKLGSQMAAIDTGTTLIGGPPNVIDAIYSQIPGVQKGSGDSDGYYFYPCSVQVNITMSFGSKVWTMDPSDFPYVRQGDLCMGAFFAVTLGGPGQLAPNWIIGDAFLKNVYSVYRYQPPAVGFAQLSNPALLNQLQGQLTVPVPSSIPATNVLTLGTQTGLQQFGTPTSVAPFASGTVGKGVSSGSVPRLRCDGLILGLGLLLGFGLGVW